MSRAIDGTRRKDRRKKILKLAKGYYGRRSTNHKTAKDAVAKSLSYAYRDRKDRKPVFRALWISRINAACRAEGISYSRFIEAATKANINLNRKALADMALNDPNSFKAVVERAKAAQA